MASISKILAFFGGIISNIIKSDQALSPKIKPTLTEKAKHKAETATIFKSQGLNVETSILVKTSIICLSVLSIALMLKAPKALSANPTTNREKNIFPEYPWLEQAASSDSHYEVLRLNGMPAGSLRYVSGNNTFVEATSFVSGGVTLWRLNLAGQVLDSYAPDGEYEGSLPYSGIFFRKDTYVDWAFSGDKTAKPYLKTFHQEALSNKQLNDLLNSAEQIVWTQETYYTPVYRGMDEDRQYHYRLKSGKSWSLVIAKEQLNATAFPAIKKALNDNHMEGYEGPPLLVDYIGETKISVTRSDSPIRLLQFQKTGVSRSGFMDINNSACTGDYGYGLFRLTLENEFFDFKSFHRIVSGREPYHDPAMAFYDLASFTQGKSKLRIVSLHGGQNPARDPSERGTYLIREKSTEKSRINLTAAEQEYLNHSNHLTLLRIDNTGLEALKGGLGNIGYFNGQQERPDGKSYNLAEKPRPLPMALSAHFNFPPKKGKDSSTENETEDNEYYSYAIKLNDLYYSWSDKRDGVFTLRFDYQEMLKAYQTLSWQKGDRPLNLILATEFVKNGVEISVSLSNGSQTQRLTQVRLHPMFAQELKPEDAHIIFDKQLINDIKTINTQYDIARKDPQKIPQTLELMRKIIRSTPYPTQFKSLAEDASWFLLNSAIEAKDQQLQLDVVNTYILDLFPLTKVNAGLDDFVERAVTLAEKTNNQDLQKNIARAFFTENPALDYRQSQFLLERTMLDQAFRLAMLNSTYIENYQWLSEKILSNNAEMAELAEKTATHYTRLIIKSAKENNYQNAKSLASFYIQKIYPTTGLDQKTSDLLSNALAVGVRSKDDSLINEVMSFIAAHPPVTEIKNHLLWFNIACYYSLQSNKEKLLEAARRSRQDGQPMEKFLTDEDFKAYRNDDEFLKAIEEKK
ncbi:MAG TPA: hypothetical protein VN030_03445 [Cellvibrio sp.]|nr:hypothetical protein [Cellvibrio sp.]